MPIIGQYLKHVFLTYCSHEPLTFFDLILIRYFLFEVIHTCITYFTYIHTSNDETKTKTYTISLFSGVDVEEFYFFNEDLKILYQQFF